MKALRVGDKVLVSKTHLSERKMYDIIEEAQYNAAQDDMTYSLLYSGAWYSNSDITFVSSDRLKTLRRAKQIELEETG